MNSLRKDPLATLKYVVNSHQETVKSIQESIDYHKSEANRYREERDKIVEEIKTFQQSIELLEWAARNQHFKNS